MVTSFDFPVTFKINPDEGLGKKWELSYSQQKNILASLAQEIKKPVIDYSTFIVRNDENYGLINTLSRKINSAFDFDVVHSLVYDLFQLRAFVRAKPSSANSEEKMKIDKAYGLELFCKNILNIMNFQEYYKKKSDKSERIYRIIDIYNKVEKAYPLQFTSHSWNRMLLSHMFVNCVDIENIEDELVFDDKEDFFFNPIKKKENLSEEELIELDKKRFITYKTAACILKIIKLMESIFHLSSVPPKEVSQEGKERVQSIDIFEKYPGQVHACIADYKFIKEKIPLLEKLFLHQQKVLEGVDFNVLSNLWGDLHKELTTPNTAVHPNPLEELKGCYEIKLKFKSTIADVVVRRATSFNIGTTKFKESSKPETKKAVSLSASPENSPDSVKQGDDKDSPRLNTASTPFSKEIIQKRETMKEKRKSGSFGNEEVLTKNLEEYYKIRGVLNRTRSDELLVLRSNSERMLRQCSFRTITKISKEKEFEMTCTVQVEDDSTFEIKDTAIRSISTQKKDKAAENKAADGEDDTKANLKGDENTLEQSDWYTQEDIASLRTQSIQEMTVVNVEDRLKELEKTIYS